MKLLLYSHYFAPSIGGVETIVMSLARGLAELRAADGSREFELTVITQTPCGQFNDQVLPFAVVRQPGFWPLLRVVREADVIHIAGPALTPLILGLVLRKPLVVEHHGFQTICPTGQLFIESRGEPCPGHFMGGRHSECWNCDPNLSWFGARRLWLLTFVRRFLCKRAAANIMPTDWLSAQLSLPRSTTIHHGLVPIQFPSKIETHPNQAPLIVFQGRLVTTKGARVLLDAARILLDQKREFEIAFIGDGPERDNLERLAKQSSLLGRVRFMGRLEPAQLDAVLQQASAVVVPSLGGEVFGMVVAENMLRGLPVIASDLGSFVEVLGDAGVTFRMGDSHGLADRLSELLASQSFAASLGRIGLKRVERDFPFSKMVGAHQLIYRKLGGGDS